MAQYTREELETISMKVLTDFLVTFNTCDPMKWTSTLNFPHVRLAGGKVQVWKTPEEYARDNAVDVLRERCNWAHTEWDDRKLIQAADDKIHIAVSVSRYTPEEKKIVSFDSFYIITNVDGHWGVQCRSSYAGIFDANTAY